MFDPTLLAMFVSPKVLHDSFFFNFFLSVRFSRNDRGKADTKIRVVRETALHSSSVELGTASYSYSGNSAKK